MVEKFEPSAPSEEEIKIFKKIESLLRGGGVFLGNQFDGKRYKIGVRFKNKDHFFDSERPFPYVVDSSGKISNIP